MRAAALWPKNEGIVVVSLIKLKQGDPKLVGGHDWLMQTSKLKGKDGAGFHRLINICYLS